MASRFIRVTRNAGGTQVSHTVDLADVTHVRRDPMTGHAVVECSNRVHIDTAEAFTTVRQRVLTADADFHDPTVFADWTGIGASGPVLVNVLQISSIGADLQRGGSDATFADGSHLIVTESTDTTSAALQASESQGGGGGGGGGGDWELDLG